MIVSTMDKKDSVVHADFCSLNSVENLKASGRTTTTTKMITTTTTTTTTTTATISK